MKKIERHPSNDSNHSKANSTKTRRSLGALALALVMLFGLGSISAFAEANNETPALLSYSTEVSEEPMTAAEVYAENVNSTVGIRTSLTTNYFGYETVSAASGSGFIVTEDGYILTNYHVVEDSQSITVTLYDDSSYEAELIGYDESNDIAVLKIDAEDLRPVHFGNSDELYVGQDVVAIGNPLGELTFSLTRGIISALNREVTLSSSLRMKLIQTDCAINSGNSGGALFNLYGEVIGITNAKYSSSGSRATVDNIGFAIPVNTVVGIVEQIMTDGEISSPYIGVMVNNVGEDLTAYGIPEGAHIVSVTEDSPADEAGLLEKDIVVAADGNPISGSDDLSDYIRSHAVGDTVTLTVYRQGKTVEIAVTIGKNVKPALPAPEEPTEDASAQNGDGRRYEGFMPGDGSLDDYFNFFFHN